MIARIHDDGEPRIGSTISLVKLSIRMGKHVDWIRRQGATVTLRGETWQVDLYNGGRRRGYILTSREEAKFVKHTKQQDAVSETRRRAFR